VRELRREDVLRYISTRQADQASHHTIAKELTVLRCALREAHRRGYVAHEPEQVVPSWRSGYVPRNRVLEPAEVEKLAAELEPDRAWWVTVALYTGGRLSEVNALEWSHIDWKAKRIQLPGTKTQKARRWIPLAKPFEDALKARKPQTGALVVPWLNPPLVLARASKRAGIPKVSPNDLRRTFASTMVRAGIPLKVVATLMGHASTAMVDRVYGHIAPSQLDDAMEQLGQRLTGTPASQSEVTDWAKEP